MIRYLLDTNTCIEYLRAKNQRLVSRLQSKRPRQIRLCSVAVGELYHGARRSASPDKNLKLILELLDTFTSMPYDDRAAEQFGRLRAALDVAGTPIGPYDLKIASIATVHGLTVVTHNIGEFSRVPGLSLEDWQS